MITLEIRQPGAAPASADLGNGVYMIGSGKECQIQIVRPEISGRHARLVVADKRISVMDLGSRNGTTINGGDAIFPNTNHDVSLGSVLRIGRAELLIKAADRPQIADGQNVVRTVKHFPALGQAYAGSSGNGARITRAFRECIMKRVSENCGRILQEIGGLPQEGKIGCFRPEGQAVRSQRGKTMDRAEGIMLRIPHCPADRQGEDGVSSGGQGAGGPVEGGEQGCFTPLLEGAGKSNEN